MGSPGRHSYGSNLRDRQRNLQGTALEAGQTPTIRLQTMGLGRSAGLEACFTIHPSSSSGHGARAALARVPSGRRELHLRAHLYLAENHPPGRCTVIEFLGLPRRARRHGYDEALRRGARRIRRHSCSLRSRLERARRRPSGRRRSGRATRTRAGHGLCLPLR